MTSKKSEAMALQTIVVAAIVLIIMVVVIAIFSGKIGFFGRSVDNCVSRGGTETSSSANCNTDHNILVPMKQDGKYCCIPIKIG